MAAFRNAFPMLFVSSFLLVTILLIQQNAVLGDGKQPCFNSTECPEHHYCYDGHCEPQQPCSISTGCPEWYYCDGAVGHCVSICYMNGAKCSTNADCRFIDSLRAVCQEGVCKCV